MAILQLTLTVELDGKELTDLSLTRRVQVDNALPFTVGQPSDAAAVDLPGIDVLTALNALIVRATDQAVIVQITDTGVGKTASPITISPGGVLLLFDCILPVGANSDPELVQLVQNSGERSTIKGLVAGAAA